jgi:hypothetical protein
MTLTTRISLLTLAIVASAPTSPTVAARQGGTLVGAWQTRVSPRICATGQVLPIFLPGLFTFHEGGTVSEWGVAPGMRPEHRSPGHGVWRHTHGWQGYTYTFTYYRYDDSGAYAGRQKVTSVLELDASGDAFVSNSAVEGYNAADELVLTACAQATGSRFQ